MSCSWSRRLKLTYGFNNISGRISFVDIDKLIPEFLWKGKEMRLAQIVLKEKKVGRITLPCFKAKYKATIFNGTGEGTGINQLKNIKNQEIDPQ